MGVRIARGLLATIRDEPDDILLQVQHPSDFDAAVRALRLAADDIAELDGGWRSAPGLSPVDRNGPKHVSDVLPAATGPFIMIDGGFTPYSVLRRIPTIVTRHLEAEGVAEAVVGSPSDDTLVGGLGYLPRAVVLHAFRPPIARRGGTALPADWISQTLAWVTRGLALEDELWGAMGSVEFPVRTAGIRNFVAQCQAFRTDLILVAGRPPRPRRSKRRSEWDVHQVRDDVLERVGGRVRAVRVGAGWVSLARGGPDVGWSELRQAMTELEDVGRTWAPAAAGAQVVADEDFRSFMRPPLHDSFDLRDIVLPYGVSAWQMLGPGHLTRLDRIPPGGRALDGGRLELSVGEPEDWLPPIRERARDFLTPCLLRADEVGSLIASRGSRPGVQLHLPELRWPTSGGGVPLREWPHHFDDLFPSVSLDLFAPLGGSGLAAPLLERARNWLLGSGASLLGATDHLAHPLTPDDIGPYLDACLESRSMKGAIASAGPPDHPCRIVRASRFADLGHLQLLLGWPGGAEEGPRMDRCSELLTIVDDLKDIARELSADLAYGFMDFADVFRGRIARWSWSSQGGASPHLSALLCDEFVIDAFHYQILGPRHLARLGQPESLGKAVDGGRRELEIGEASAWLQPEGLELVEGLRPCLPSVAERDRMSRARMAAVALARGGLVQVLDALGCAGGPLDGLADARPAVVLRLFPELVWDASGRWQPESLVDHLLRFAATGDDTDPAAWGALEWCLQLPLEASQLEIFFRQAWRQPVTTAIVTGDLGQRVRLASTTVHRGLVLAEAGSALDEDGTRSAFSRLCDVARAIAAEVPVLYAFVSLDPTLGAAVAEDHQTEWTRPPPAAVDPWRDQVPDAFPFQVLGRGHAERLGATAIGTRRLAHEAVELSLGDPMEWLPGRPSRAQAHEAAAAVLAPLLPP